MIRPDVQLALLNVLLRLEDKINNQSLSDESREDLLETLGEAFDLINNEPYYSD